MMRKTRRLTSILVLIAMLCLIAVPAMATGTETGTETGSITIDNAVVDKNYTIYRIFDLESYNTDSKAYSYRVNSKWNAFFGEGGDGAEYVTFNEEGYVIWNEHESAANFAAAAKTYADETLSEQYDGTVIAKNTTVKFENLQLGYYLIVSDLGSLCTLDTTNPDVTVKEKNDGTTLTKDASLASVNIGGTVSFTITLTIQKNSNGEIKNAYLVHDKMEEGLTFNSNSVKVFCNERELENREFTVKQNCDDNCTFEVEISEIENLNEHDKIVITYDATLNEKADIGAAGNTNVAWLVDSYKAETKTYTYQFDLVKTDENQAVLDGATFKLYDAENDGNEISLIENSDSYRVATAAEAAADGFQSAVIKAGKATIKGLGNGTYWLAETKAPDGYNKLEKRVEVTIKDGNLTAEVTEISKVLTWQNGGVRVINKTGNELPSTGGIGTTIFYVVGGVLVVGAGVLLVTRKRMNAEK